MEFLIIPIMAILGRMEGGGFFSPKLADMGLKFLPCLLFAAPFGFLTDNLLLSVLIILYSFFAKNMGHGVALLWGDKVPESEIGRKQSLSPLVDYAAKVYGIQKYQDDGYSPTKNYCRLFMAVKGFFIGLPLLPFGFSMVILQPLAYEIGVRVKSHATSEYLAGGFAGFVLWAVL